MDQKERALRAKRYSIDEIQKAFHKLWAVATVPNNKDSLMHIPPQQGDVDLVLQSAIDELDELRRLVHDYNADMR